MSNDTDFRMEDTDKQRGDMKSDRRLAVIYIPYHCIIDVLKGRALVSNIPDGAEVVQMYLYLERMSLALVVRHESFEEQEDGALLPELIAEFTTVDPGFTSTIEVNAEGED